MQKINILFVVTELELGGAQTQLLELLRRLDKDRFRPFLLSGRRGLLIPEASLIEGLFFKKAAWLKRSISPLEDILALIEIYLFIKKHKIRIIHTHSSKAGILGRLAAALAGVKPVIHTVHGWSFNDYQHPFLRKLFVSLERIASSFTDTIIVVCEHDKQRGLTSKIGAADKYLLIRYGIDYARFGKADKDIRRGLGIDASGLVVGMISCFKPQKSVKDFIEAARLIAGSFPEVSFILIGDGALRKDIEKLISSSHLEGKIILTGWRRDIPEILSAMDIFVLTSLWEGLPIVVLEALASGKPVVATNTGGISEVIHEGKNGFLVPPRDTGLLCEKLSLLLKDRELRMRLGAEAGRTLNQDFFTDNMLKSTQDLYNELVFN
ncbi:MAG TPA: glycosyltransferase family 4 protein [Candidatus Margulisiibacteriota bacterium]|nr:glycosyltransferase family 4 protein [Candidatus Margulisiibacteriota bacterium]